MSVVLSESELLSADLNSTEFERCRMLVSGDRLSGKTKLAQKLADRWGVPWQMAHARAQLSGLCESVAEEIALGLETLVDSRDELSRRVHEAATELGIEHLLARNPLELSGGQSQLTVLACLWAMKPGVLVVDEPLTGLDTEARSRVLAAFARYDGAVMWTASRVNREARKMTTHRVVLGVEGSTEAEVATDPGNTSGGVTSKDFSDESANEPLLEVRDLAIHPVTFTRRGFLGKKVQTSEPIVSGVNIELSRGEILALQGPNGSGKTTLLRTLAGLIPSVGGSFTVEGKSIAELKPQERVQKICLAAQNPALQFLTTSVESEISLGRTAQNSGGFRQELLAVAGLAGRSEVHPHDLSPVEQHLLSIVRAVAARPAVLLLDEPTGRVDARGVGQVLQLVQGFCEDGGAVIVASHDEEFLGKLPHRPLNLSE